MMMMIGSKLMKLDDDDESEREKIRNNYANLCQCGYIGMIMKMMIII